MGFFSCGSNVERIYHEPENKVADEAKAPEVKEHLNFNQKSIIRGFLNESLFKLINGNLTPQNAIKALNAVFSNKKLSDPEFNSLRGKEVLSGVAAVRAVLAHECPENRAVGMPTEDPDWVGWEQTQADGTAIFLTEKKGLLGLTARNNDTAFPVTKTAVINHIGFLIDQQIQLKKVELSNLLQQKDNIPSARPRGLGRY